MSELVDGVMDLFPGADRQALNCLEQLVRKQVAEEAASVVGAEVGAEAVLAWLKAQPGVSYVATIKDVEEAMRAVGANVGTEPTEEMMKAAEEAVMAEWEIWVREARPYLNGETLQPWPVSPTNWRILRAGWKAMFAVGARVGAGETSPEKTQSS